MFVLNFCTVSQKILRNRKWEKLTWVELREVTVTLSTEKNLMQSFYKHFYNSVNSGEIFNDIDTSSFIPSRV